MSRFLFLNFQDFNPGNEISDITQCSNLCCACCLEKNTQFINLTKCSHAGFLLYCTKMKIENTTCQVICAQCHAMLMKIELFRKQIEDSFYLLNTQSLQIDSTDSKRTRLKIQKTVFVDITPFPVKSEDLAKKQTDLTEAHTATVEVKTEPICGSDASDDDSNVPLNEFKCETEIETADPQPENKYVITENTLKNIKRNIRKKKASKPEFLREEFIYPTVTGSKRAKFEGKIREFDLTEEELTEERRQLSQSEKYLKLPFRCESCLVGFDHEPILLDHMGKKHPKPKEKEVVCRVCQTVLNKENSLRGHMQRHYRRYECLKCHKRLGDIHTITQHYNEQHETIDETLHQCNLCDFTTLNYRAFRYHKEKHRGVRQCTKCGQTLANLSGLRNHMYAQHGSGRLFRCVPCDKTYRHRSGLVLHNKAYHSDSPRAAAYCAPCNKNFNTEQSLQTHLKMHSAHRKPEHERFECDICNKRFVMKSELVSHINYKHLRDTKHKCLVCGNKSFRTGSTLRKHIKQVHNKEQQPRDKICHHCGKGFTSTAILRTHIRTHTGERPLTCPHCPATFAHPAARYTHIKLVHKKMTATNKGQD